MENENVAIPLKDNVIVLRSRKGRVVIEEAYQDKEEGSHTLWIDIIPKENTHEVD